MTRTRVLQRLVVLAAAAGALLLSGCGNDDSGAPAEVALTPAGEEGREIAQQNGCMSCHSVDGRDGIGPTWLGLAGSEVTLEDGTVVTADEEYLRTSIVEPNAQIVEGFRGIMPERQLDPAEVDAMVTYLQELADG